MNEILIQKGIALPRQFCLKEDGTFKCCSNSCSFYPFYVYAENMEELIDKIMDKNREMFDKEVNRACKEMGITLK